MASITRIAALCLPRAVLVAATLALAAAAPAAAVTLALDTAFAGEYPGEFPASAPFAVGTFTDTGKQQVQIALTFDEGVRDDVYAINFYLNFGPNSGNLLDPGALKFVVNEKLSSAAPDKIFQEAPNLYVARDGGAFDIRVQFPTADKSAWFMPGKTVVMDVSSDTVAFDASSFFNLSCKLDGAGKCAEKPSPPVFSIAAHLEIESARASSWIASAQDPAAVPVPAAAWLLGAGLAGLAAAGRRRKSKAGERPVSSRRPRSG